MGKIVVLVLFCSVLRGQTNSGELRLKITDPSGLAVTARIHVISEGNQYQRMLSTDEQGTLTLQRLPYGRYQLQINVAGFAEVSESIDVRSSIPTEHSIQLRIAARSESVTVSAAN